MIRISIEAKTVDELVSQLREWVERLDLQETVESMYPESQLNLTPVIAEPVNEELVEQVVVEKPKAAKGRKTKETVDVVTSVVVEPATETVVVQSAQQEPKNFYSPSEFNVSFAKIINHLIVAKDIDQTYLSEISKTLGITFIYQASANIVHMNAIYEDLVNKNIITRKGDY